MKNKNIQRFTIINFLDCGDDNNHSNAVTPLENSRFYKNEDRTENSNFEEVKDEIIVDYVDLLTEEEMVEE